MNGIINFNKPVGITSCRAIGYVKKAFKAKKAGHTGTLDPNANGVLPICLGKATQIVQFVINLPKTYRGKMRLGIRTDTQDADGKIISESSDYKDIDRERLENIFLKYTGPIEQIPPMYSAVRVKGKRLYTLARKGITIKRDPKKVTVYYFKLLDFKDGVVNFEAKTSAGTYIRTLCDDIGNDLGCGAYLAELTRSSVGGLKIEDALTLEDMNNSSIGNGLKDRIYSVDETLSFLPSIKINTASETLLKSDKSIKRGSIEDFNGEPGPSGFWRVHNSVGKLLGVASSLWEGGDVSLFDKEQTCFKMKKILS